MPHFFQNRSDHRQTKREHPRAVPVHQPLWTEHHFWPCLSQKILRCELRAGWGEAGRGGAWLDRVGLGGMVMIGR